MTSALGVGPELAPAEHPTRLEALGAGLGAGGQRGGVGERRWGFAATAAASGNSNRSCGRLGEVAAQGLGLQRLGERAGSPSSARPLWIATS
ncbi:hypothetical protein [Nannocystis exedens]|uniref:hypothetical protein n=1 Tax=Nannocystis exedens TaxID=54 RepID=UPI001475984B|nr:hypothetical protein [Nannocystis exedens]